MVMLLAGQSELDNRTVPSGQLGEPFAMPRVVRCLVKLHDFFEMELLRTDMDHASRRAGKPESLHAHCLVIVGPLAHLNSP